MLAFFAAEGIPEAKLRAQQKIEAVDVCKCQGFVRRKFMIFRDADEQVFLHKRASTVNRKRQNGNVARAVLPCAQDLFILADGGSNHFSGCAALSAFKSSQSGAGAQDFTRIVRCR